MQTYVQHVKDWIVKIVAATTRYIAFGALLRNEMKEQWATQRKNNNK